MKAFAVALTVIIAFYSLSVVNSRYVCGLSKELMALEGNFPDKISESTSQDPYIKRATEVLDKNYNYLNAVCHTEQISRVKLCLERTKRGYLDGDGMEYRRARVELKEALHSLIRSEGLDPSGII